MLKDVRVSSQGKCWITVSQTIRQQTHIHPGANRQTRIGVAQVMKADDLHPAHLAQHQPVPGVEIAAVEQRAFGAWKDQALILPVTGARPLEVLCDLVRREHVHLIAPSVSRALLAARGLPLRKMSAYMRSMCKGISLEIST
jgi:hypothetical protein